jgi:hypothetical protein
LSSLDDHAPAYEPAPYDPVSEAKRNSVETLAGLFAAGSLFVSLIALAYHPVPLSICSALLALVAAAMSSLHRTLCFAAVIVSGVCFVAGMTIAIVTGHSLW